MRAVRTAHAQNHVTNTPYVTTSAQCFGRERNLCPAPFTYAYANDVKYDGCFRRPYLAWAAPSFWWFIFTPAYVLRKQRSLLRQAYVRTYVRESAYLAHLLIQRVNPRTHP